MQVVWEVFEDIDDGGSTESDLLAYIRPSMVGDGGQGPQSEVARVVLFDEG